jgi:hypothetical protein
MNNVEDHHEPFQSRAAARIPGPCLVSGEPRSGRHTYLSSNVLLVLSCRYEWGGSESILAPSSAEACVNDVVEDRAESVAEPETEARLVVGLELAAA